MYTTGGAEGQIIEDSQFQTSTVTLLGQDFEKNKNSVFRRGEWKM